MVFLNLRANIIPDGGRETKTLSASTENFARKAYYLALAVAILYLVYLLRNVLVPFALAGILAYALTPAARFLKRRGLPWKISVALIFLLLLAFFAFLFFLIVPETISQVRALTAHLPEYTGKIIDIARVIDERYPGLNLARTLEDFLHNLTTNLQSYLTGLIKNIFDLVSFLMNVIFIGFVLTPFILYYFMIDAVKIRRALLSLFPVERRKEYVFLLRKIDAVVGGFIRGRLLTCLFVGVCVGVGLFFMSIEFPLVIGVIAGIADIIPYLGPIIGAVPALVFAASKSIFLVLGVVALFVGVNLVEGVAITPKFLGKETGLHPITVLFALIVGGKLYGALGVIVAIPVAGVLKELFNYYRHKSFPH